MPSSWKTLPSWVGARWPCSCSSNVSGWRGDRAKMPWLSGEGAGAGAAGGLEEDLEVAGGRLFLLEEAAEHLAGCVVDARVQHELGAARFQPGGMAPVGLGGAP